MPVELKICYVLSYRAPEYIRTSTLLCALRQIPGVLVHEAINTSCDMRRYCETYARTSAIIKKFDPDIYVLGFRGHEFYWPLRRLVGNKPIVLDALMSPHASLCHEKKWGVLGAALGYLWRPIERSILQDAQRILTDTEQNVRFYREEFALSNSKLLAIPVGAVENVPGPDLKFSESATAQPEEEFRVLFYGSFLPLHGVDIVVKAASLLQDLPIYFDFIGGNRKQARKLAENCITFGVTKFSYRRWVSFDELVNITIPNTDLCLGGPFGNTEQARRVITGKTSQCMALGKATIIGYIDESVGFVDRENCLLVPQGDSFALAATIRWAFEQKDRLSSIGESGRSMYFKGLSVDIIRQRLEQMLMDMCKN